MQNNSYSDGVKSLFESAFAAWNNWSLEYVVSQRSDDAGGYRHPELQTAWMFYTLGRVDTSFRHLSKSEDWGIKND